MTQQTDPDKITALRNQNGTIYFDYHGWHARLQGKHDNLIRFTVTPASWPTQPSIPRKPQVDKHADETIATGGSGQHFDAPIVTSHDQTPLKLADGKIHLPEATLTLANGHIAVTHDRRLICTLKLPQLTATSWTMMVQTAPGAAYFGGGTQNGRVCLNGQLIQIHNDNRWTKGSVSSPVPFYWCTSGYGLLINSFTPGQYDFGDPHRGAYLTHSDRVFDAYLIIGQTPAKLIQGFETLTGKPNLNPRFAFYPAHFNAYNRDYWVAVTADSAGAIQFPDGKWYKEYQPIKKETFNTGFRPGTITIDDLTLVPNVYGNGHVTFTDTNADGTPRHAIHESLNGEHNYQFSARAVLDRYAQNNVPLGWLLPNDGYGAGYGQTDSLAGDLTNLHQFSQYAAQRGVTTGLWTQAALEPKDPAHPQKGERDFAKEIDDGGLRAIKTDVAWVGQGYTFGLNATTKAAAAFAKRDLRPMIVTLDGWAGTQRAATVWTGDQAGSDWVNLKTHIGSYLAAGLSGQPNIASDIDGIYAGSDPVIQTRDLEWKSFTPTFFAMDGWGDQPKLMGMQAGAPYDQIDREFLQHHTMLIPYLYSLAHVARETGTPIMRPTFWAEPNAYTYSDALEDQLLVGPSLLLAPIVNAYGLHADGSSLRDHLYLPKGEWVDFWTGTRLTGARTLADIATPLNRLPVYVRAGALIPLLPPHQNPAATPQQRLLDYYPGPASAFSVYEDDGATLAYQRSEYAETRLHATTTNGVTTLTIDPTKGQFAGQQETVPLSIFIAGNVAGDAAVTIDGNPMMAQTAAGPRQNDPLHRSATGLTISLPAVSIRQQVQVQLHIHP